MSVIEHRDYTGREPLITSHPRDQVCPDCYVPRGASQSISENKMTMTRDERSQRIGMLTQAILDQKADFPDGDYPPEARTNLCNWGDELARHRSALDQLETRDQDMRDGVRSGRYAVENEAQQVARYGRKPSEDREVPPFVRSARDQGLRAIERCVDLGARNDDAVRIEKLVREEDSPTAFGARWLAACGDPDYRSAFLTLLADPTMGHMQLDQRQVEAVRTVKRLQVERAMGVTTGSAGGFGIPIDLDPTILSTGSAGLNPIRSIARIIPTVGDVSKGVAADAPTAAYQAEAAEMTDNSPTLVQPVITTQRGSAFVPVSFEIFQDWPQDQLANELTNLLAESRFNVDNLKWFSGTGTNEPGGLLNIGGTGGLTTTQRVQTATVATTALADIYTFKAAVHASKFMGDAVWAIHPTVLDAFFRFVGSGSTTEPQIFTQGRGGPLLGKQVVEWTSLQTSLTTTGNKLAVLGDWTGFAIVDRLGSTVEIIPQLFGAAQRPTGQRGVVCWWRSSSGVIKPNALRYLEVK
jgi:HK97 family phage major capsid protein